MAAWNAAFWAAAAVQGLLVTRLVVGATGEDGWGVWATVGSLRGFLLFVDSGLAFGVSRDAARGAAGDGGTGARIRAARRVYAGLAALALAVFAAAAGLPGLVLGLAGADADAARGVTLLLGAETAAALVASPLHAVLRGRQRFDALAAAGWAHVTLSVSAVALLAPRHGLVGAACGIAGARIVVALGTWAWTRSAGHLPARGGVPAETLRSVVSFAAPLWVIGLGTQIGAGTDVPVVGAFHGAETAGQYALGATLPAAAASLLFAILGASFPRMVTVSDEERPRLAGALLFMASFLAAAGFGFLALHADAVLGAWLGRAPEFSGLVAVVACASWTLNAPAHVLSNLAIARGRHGIMGPVVLCEAVANLLLSLALAAWWSPLGPAVATLATIAVSNVLVVPALLRPRLGLRWGTILRPVACGLGIGLAVAAAVRAVTGVAGGGAWATLGTGAALTVLGAGLVLDLTVRRESWVRRATLLTLHDGWRVLRRQREEVAAERSRLDAERAARPPVAAGGPPLVTVRIATYNRGRLVADRAIASALRQTHANVEVLVVGDCCDAATAEAVLSVKDPRVRFVNLPERGRYPENPRHRWMVAGAAPMNHALEIARGEWIAPLDDDDEFTPDHVEVLLRSCRERGLEFAWGVAEMEQRDGTWTRCGGEPLAHGRIVHAAVLWSAAIRLRHDVESWRIDEPGDWNLWRRMRDAGVRMGFVDHVVTRHYREAREVRVVRPFWEG